MYRQPKHFKKSADKKSYFLCSIERKDIIFRTTKDCFESFEYFTLPKAKQLCNAILKRDRKLSGTWLTICVQNT